MGKFFLTLKTEQLAGVLLVLALHGMLLYGLISYRMLPPPEEAITLMVELINPPAQSRPEPTQPPQPVRPQPIAPLQQLVAQAVTVLPDEPIAPPPPLPAPVFVPVMPVLPALPPQAVTLSAELSVNCPERTPPAYPSFSIRLNEQGRVVLRVELDAEGRISDVSFKSRSGSVRLDEAAVAAVKTWRCRPAIREGLAVPAVALQPFDFILEGH